jgi:putative endonuclease
VLCFIEVKTRTTRDIKPAEAAVDREKRRALRKVVRDYLQTLPRRRFPETPTWRFDVVTVYYERSKGPGNPPLASLRANSLPTFEVFQNASL